MDALVALDKDGDLYLPNDMELPRSCESLGAEQALEASGLLAGDCDDDDDDRHPNQEEICGDGKDQDCDGDDTALITAYVDVDLDGYGDPSVSQDICGAQDGFVENDLDCDDLDPTVNPDAVEETCGDDVDQDCDGVTACPLSGDIDLSTGDWAELGVLVAMAPGGGAALSSGVDLSGDGVGDLAVGGSSAAWTVAVGSDRSPVATPLALGFGEDEGAGAAIALIEDVDGDGLGEVAVGAPGWDDFYDDMGRVLIAWSGAPDSPSEIHGEGKEDFCGAVLRGASGGLAVGQYTGDSWRVFLFGGSGLPVAGESMLLDSGSEDTRITGVSGDEESLPALWSQSKSDWSDFAVGQAAYSSGKGRAQLFFGVNPSSGVVDAAGATVTSATSADLGASVAMVDMDADGLPDLAVGAPGEKAVYIFLGLTSDSTTSRADYVFSGATGTGAALAPAGDVNGDGAGDLIVGAPAADTAYLLQGGATLPTDTDVVRATAVITGAVGSQLGAALAGDDVDGDGYDDVIIGAPGADGVFVFWGGP